MMHRLIVMTLLSTAACGSGATLAKPATRLPDAAWLTGIWLVIEEPADRDLVACASGLPIAYRSDSTYMTFEESGAWRLDGTRLIETTTEVSEQADPADFVVGSVTSSRIARVGPGEMRKTWTDGVTRTLLRCPVGK